MWQDEWPTESGMWWLYGWCWHKPGIREKPEPPELHLVRVHKTQTGVIYITGGHFLYKEEGAEGKWLRAKLPALPKGVKAR